MAGPQLWLAEGTIGVEGDEEDGERGAAFDGDLATRVGHPRDVSLGAGGIDLEHVGVGKTRHARLPASGDGEQRRMVGRYCTGTGENVQRDDAGTAARRRRSRLGGCRDEDEAR